MKTPNTLSPNDTKGQKRELLALTDTANPKTRRKGKNSLPNLYQIKAPKTRHTIHSKA